MPGGYNIFQYLVYIIDLHVIALAMELSLAHQYDSVLYWKMIY